MSYSQLLEIIENDGKITYEVLKEYQNSHNFIQPVCNLLFPDKKLYEIDGELISNFLNDKESQSWEKTILLLQYGTFTISRSRFDYLISDIENFVCSVRNPGHWCEILQDIKELFSAQYKHVSRIAFIPTSTSDNPFDGDYDEKTDKFKPVSSESIKDVYQELQEINWRISDNGYQVLIITHIDQITVDEIKFLESQGLEEGFRGTMIFLDPNFVYDEHIDMMIRNLDNNREPQYLSVNFRGARWRLVAAYCKWLRKSL